MQISAGKSYLDTEVMTATPQKLQLMLIEAAIRAARRARKKWLDGRDDEACEDLIHAQQIVSELLGGLDPEVNADLVKKVASVYMFVFRSLMEANHDRSEKKLEDAIRVLEVERGTWQKVCAELGSHQASDRQEAGGLSLEV